MMGVVRRVPGWAWAALGGVLLLWGVIGWHEARLTDARREGAVAQEMIDRAAFQAAAADAAAAQGRLVRALADRQQAISKESDDALGAGIDDLGRRYDDLRLRWAAAGAGGGGAGDGGTTAVPGPAGPAFDTACAAGGWVDFTTASAAAEAADTAIAKDDAWIAWAAAQAEAHAEVGPGAR